jgi:YYY domain-containing protein
MLATILWWLAIQAIALLALPITVRLLRFLPDRGVGMARPVGLLLAGYLYWLLVTCGLLRNGIPAVLAVLLVLGACSALVWRRGREGVARSLAGRWRQVAVGEALFALGLAAFAIFRAYNPDIAFTEKPMEFGFINGILRSSTFPPRDPWLSGYAISYYYFGYVMVAMMTLLTGLSSAITFNLANATLFALTLSGAYSLVANMIAAAREQRAGGAERGSGAGSWGVLGGGVLGAALVAVAGNLEGVLEFVRARGWGSAALYAWFDVRNLTATGVSSTWYPDDGWWWWRASRVIHDRNALGQSVEVIDEFPFFSFLLGDNHPHVLALPFILLALTLALNLLLSGREEAAPREEGQGPLWRRLLRGVWGGWALDVPLWGLLIGALGFLNTWDYPIYLGIFLLAYLARRAQECARGDRRWLSDGVTLGLLFGGLGLAYYLPFYAGFRSQAGGLGLVRDVKTRLPQYLLMFGTQVTLVAGYLLAELGRLRRERPAVPRAAWLAWGAAAALGAGCLALGWATAALGLALAGLAGGLALWLTAPAGGSAEGAGAPGGQPAAFDAAGVLVMLMVVAGALLTVAVEFIYLRDSFGSRMNTVFKFYYQAWVLLSVAGAYGVWQLLSTWRHAALSGRLWWGAWAGAGAALLAGALAYPAMATVSKANGFRGEPTLDGVRYVARSRPAEYAAILWLQENAPEDAVMAEASGGSYTEYNWISAHTGIPTLLGWGGHELQWRGSYDEPVRREEALGIIYRSNDPAQIAALLQEYGVRYVLVGPNERAMYGANQVTLSRFDRLMDRVFENDAVIIFGPRDGGVPPVADAARGPVVQ